MYPDPDLELEDVHLDMYNIYGEDMNDMTPLECYISINKIDMSEER